MSSHFPRSSFAKSWFDLPYKKSRPIPFFKMFTVCPINEVASALEIAGYAYREAYKILHVFHCEDFFSIPREIQCRIQSLSKKC